MFRGIEEYSSSLMSLKAFEELCLERKPSRVQLSRLAKVDS